MEKVEMTGQEEQDRQKVQEMYAKLLDEYMHSNHRKKVDLIKKAFDFADKAHYDARRRSGEPYIMHPLAVARIVCNEMGLGSTSICSALLHDVVEDTGFEVEDIESIYRKDTPPFGRKVGEIVDGLTKISGGIFAEQAAKQAARQATSQDEAEQKSKQTENFRKLFLTMNNDIRVVLIKLADRLHNMRTLDVMSQEKKHKITGETLFLYAPLAHRLGLYAIKTELENLCLKHENPEAYQEIDRKLKEKEAVMESLFDKFTVPVDKKLKAMGIDYVMTKRVKSHFSIWSKMEARGLPFEEVYDLFAVRIVFESQEGISDKDLCWRIYSAITDIYRMKPDRIRDFVSNPKTNGYQALHVTVMGPDGQWIEVQIRSRKMDDIDERGLAAHWKYKDHSIEEDAELGRLLDDIRTILEHPTPDLMDTLDRLKLTLYESDIKVFTPKGDIKTLPKGASALDFAYELHSDIGNTAIAAKVNHILVPISRQLAGGDQIEIVTSKTQMPVEEWLGFVKTAKARLDITTALKRIRRENAQQGKAKLLVAFTKAEIEPHSSLIDKVAAYYGFTSREDLYCAIEKGDVPNYENVRKILKTKSDLFEKFAFLRKKEKGKKEADATQGGETATSVFDRKKPFLLTQAGLNRDYVLAECCKPILGDETVGFIDRDKLVVHKRMCPSAINRNSKYGDRIVVTVWSGHAGFSFEATVRVEGIDAIGVLSNISKTILEYNVNILHLEIKTMGGIFEGKIKLNVHNVEDVLQLCKSLSGLENITSAYRISD
ncbi:MAG: RelA/SpoT family protein [Tannerella sp.]|jgi:GTP pyrophosphokinase|nr:RelA/SpoT family protein [Tannerella sp.]